MLQIAWKESVTRMDRVCARTDGWAAHVACAMIQSLTARPV
jgi:hypothetical protein